MRSILSNCTPHPRVGGPRAGKCDPLAHIVQVHFVVNFNYGGGLFPCSVQGRSKRVGGLALLRGDRESPTCEPPPGCCCNSKELLRHRSKLERGRGDHIQPLKKARIALFSWPSD